MLAYSTVKRVILQTGDPTERKVRFMALLTSALPKRGARPVLVGGSAVEVYLDGVLRTGDMDVVHEPRALRPVLEAWRFDLGTGMRAWVNDELGLAVDMVGGELAGSTERTTTITTDYGPATIIGVEDLVLKRLASAKHWKVPADMEQAYLLAKAFEEKLDWAYVEAEAGRGLVADYLQTLKRMLADTRSSGSSSRFVVRGTSKRASEPRRSKHWTGLKQTDSKSNGRATSRLPRSPGQSQPSRFREG